jgi:hypothetical protein
VESALGRDDELFHLISGYRVSQAIYVVFKLGIPDRIGL